MAAQDVHNPAEGYVQTPHPVQGLPRVVRHITGHDAEGKSVFLSTDISDHHRELVDKPAIANIIYSTGQHPVDLDGAVDVKFGHENEPGISVKNGTVCRMIDFAPGGVSAMHRVQSLDYAVRGDIAIQRSTSHWWINVTGNGLLPARILFVLLDTKDLNVAGNQVDTSLGVLSKDYVRLPGHAFRDNDYMESEF
ncbi:hypothetical protein DM02DRAFT_658300 [Periconia macrospinosa]|uniref:Uncharacterized protein n=1 Tax=Periconia macrospinosa TaxID=97972 RepID=A0A2V1DJY9_9PLEO|nr:hypothetical protein DM02DRAFT_658300 [Periconia macrospinosa]